jgi:phenylacetate-coenzyme A ligase PaaK-like adenylate-forming protein
MTDLNSVFEIGSFSIIKTQKDKIHLELMEKLIRHHYTNCMAYKKMLDSLQFEVNQPLKSILDVPFLPVSLFKKYELKSIDSSEVFKILYSSGTTGESVSKIYLDKKTSSLQQKTLIKIVSDFLGIKRSPMLIFDSKNSLKDRDSFSARGAAILGFSLFGTERCFAFDDEMNFDSNTVLSFLEKYNDKQIVIFGFTYIVWNHFYKGLKNKKIKINLTNALLIHGGGWKKLLNESVSNDIFKTELKHFFGISEIHDYYGMVEQTGSIYLECSKGYLHTNIFNDVIMRRSYDFSVCDFGESGIVQVLSLLPFSYCGHSILTEDLGILYGIDDCNCGKSGKYFKIIGRIEKAALRGCSDTYDK